jgi:glycosyltransferase involved in cell wall biosynthesis
VKALHIFPQFGPDLVNGSERYEYMLSSKLVELGVEVDVLTTRTRSAYPTSAFTSAWPNDFPTQITTVGGIRIQRFAATFHIRPRMGHALSRRILRRWEREERRCGAMVRGSRNLVDYYQGRALARPRIYDLVMLAARGPCSFSLLAHLAANIRRYDAVMVGFTPYALMPQVVAMARMMRRPVVVLPLFHPQDPYHHFAAFYRCFARADAVLAQTSYSAALLERLAPGCTPVDLGAGVNLDDLADTRANGARFRFRHGLEGKKIVLFVGRKEFFKRYDLAVEAIELIGDDRVRLVMIGRDIDGQPVSSRYAAYLGEVDHQDLIDAYDACDVFLLPSENESFGMVFLEAWARRKPVIGNRACGPVACLIEDGENGYLCSTAAEIAERIAQLAANPELGARLGRKGYQKVVTRYTWDAIAARVRDLYLRLASGAQPVPAWEHRQAASVRASASTDATDAGAGAAVEALQSPTVALPEDNSKV